jgi:uncharacterized membrane protein YbhN (UPF0104 family)
MKYLRWLGTLALIVWILSLIDFRKTLELLATTRLDLILLVFVVLLLIRLFMAWRWLYVLRVLRIKAGFLEVFRITMISIALSLVMPGGHATVDAYRTWSLSRIKGSVSTVTASVVADRIFGSYSLVLLAFIAIIFVRNSSLEIDWLPLVAGIFGIATLAVLLLVIFGPTLIHRSAWFLSWWPKGREGLESVAAQLKDGSVLRKIAIPSTLLALPVQVLRAVEFFLIYKAIGVDIGLGYMLLYTPIIFVVMELPISVAGIGLREGGFYVLLAPHGVTVDAVVAAGILFHVVGVLMGLPGAVWVSRGSRELAEDQEVDQLEKEGARDVELRG